ncbi:hypothetical protein HK100_001276 [Physocladia obscura]|uniref:Uncharacterized protein n=1 Tax=Physocladia obscura TaxID=109957 RepID=A0AAD5SZK8_9FUNG|nr:hypothetical protein HK100_001276 [Physocladia obscura]
MPYNANGAWIYLKRARIPQTLAAKKRTTSISPGLNSVNNTTNITTAAPFATASVAVETNIPGDTKKPITGSKIRAVGRTKYFVNESNSAVGNIHSNGSGIAKEILFGLPINSLALSDFDFQGISSMSGWDDDTVIVKFQP